MDARERARSIGLVLLDVDGVLTDGRLHYGPDGEERKSFHVHDGLGIQLARRAGVLVGIVTARDSRTVARRAEELGLDEVFLGCRRKIEAWEDVLARRDLPERAACFMGDDLLDLPVLRRAGLAAAPADARPEVSDAAHWRSSRPGGAGCVRELLEFILEAQGRWSALVSDPG